jgi:hypothetical protein
MALPAKRPLDGEILPPSGEAMPYDDGDTLEVADLVRMFEESEESTYEARQASERDWDFYDGKQWTADELAELKKRGQPPTVANDIQPKVDFLIGVEKSQRIDPRAMPRTPQHEDDADGATKALKYVSDEQLYDESRSEAWKDMLIKGSCGMNVTVEHGYEEDELCVKVDRVPWDRMFADPHSAKPDYSDANYWGTVTWMDYDDALMRYPEGAEALDATLDSANVSDTYDDKPKFNLWADRKRKRVRVCEIWIKRGDDYHFAEFTKGGILNAGPSPFQDDKGQSDNALFFQSAYVDRDNNRYGLVRNLVPLQEEKNKRRSKALHLLNTAQVVMREGSLSTLNDVERVRKEASRPDGLIVLAPSNNPISADFEFNPRTDLATGHVQLLQEIKNEMDRIGPNATMMGDKAQGSSAASGRAIIASQQGGMMQIRDLLDKLAHLDKRVFRAIWNRIRQFWTGQKWIRVTDDERNIRWLGINIDPMQMQMAMQQDPSIAEKIHGTVGNVAELDCDIIIDEAPDSVTPALEQWQALIELEKARPGTIPTDVLIKSAPNLKDKADLLKGIKEAQQNQGPSPEQQKAQAEMQKLQAEMQMKQQGMQMDMAGKQADMQIDAAKAEREGLLEGQKFEREMAMREQESMQKMQLAEVEARNKLEIARVTAAEQNRMAQQKAAIDADSQQRSTDAKIDSQKQTTDAKIATQKQVAKAKPAPAKPAEPSKGEKEMAELRALMEQINKKLSMKKVKRVVKNEKGRITHVEESLEG